MTDKRYNEILSTLALTKVQGLNSAHICSILATVEDVTEIFATPDAIYDILPGATPALVAALSDKSAVECAKKEIDFTTEKGIKIICIGDDDYPYRLKECSDAPPVIYTMGNVNLNAKRIVSIVGTRRATDYGKDMCTAFVNDIARMLPDTLIVSGLAYGIDVCAHRTALKAGLPTIGVLAHGFHRIYPTAHRSIAKEMLSNGGLLTEYMSGIEPFRQNFLQRNRIVAGIADATVVVESPSHGGSLVTASIAQSYMRDCFAFPGRVNDQYSIGCNELILRNKAALITSAYDFIEAMNWGEALKSDKPREAELFPELSPDEQRLLDFLRENSEGVQLNQLVVTLDMPVNRIMPILFELEMKNLIRTQAGGAYRALV